jgi:uncharacterized BrkB/YihY/UPF0761 family membrane protein
VKRFFWVYSLAIVVVFAAAITYVAMRKRAFEDDVTRIQMDALAHGQHLSREQIKKWIADLQ